MKPVPNETTGVAGTFYFPENKLKVGLAKTKIIPPDDSSEPL
jgi:hypothetical protein